jgi:hydroxymethylbilane synthase
MKHLTIATRESALALWQANFIKSELERHHPQLKVSLLGMHTQGDRWLNAPLREIGGKGLFIKELEAALVRGDAQLAVHSMKDLPAALPEEFALGAIGYRADVRDVLVGVRDGIEALPQGARVGTSSLRRQAQLLAVRPDLLVSSIRGNVGTRLQKQRNGEFDAIVLAAAGLTRLGLSLPDSSLLEVEASLPAAGQGALGVECLAAAEDVRRLLEPLNDVITARCVATERLVSAGLGADCSMPVAAYAQMQGDTVFLRALIASADGRTVIRASARGADSKAAADAVVGELLRGGAADILAGLSRD